MPANQYNLNVASSGALVLGSGVTIKADGAGPDLIPAVPVRGAFSLGDGKSIVVYTTAPVLYGGLPFPNATGVAKDASFQLKFSENVTLVTTKVVGFKRLDNDALARSATVGTGSEVVASGSGVAINPARDFDGPTKAVTNKALVDNVATLTTSAAH